MIPLSLIKQFREFASIQSQEVVNRIKSTCTLLNQFRYNFQI